MHKLKTNQVNTTRHKQNKITEVIHKTGANPTSKVSSTRSSHQTSSNSINKETANLPHQIYNNTFKMNTKSYNIIKSEDTKLYKQITQQISKSKSNQQVQQATSI